MDHKVWMYLAYLIVSIALTVWVATTLSRNGAIFLEDVFADTRLARATNQLLVMGFYLLNLGFVAVAMRSSTRIPDAARALETLSYKIGFVLLVLGVLHVCNVFFLGRYRRGRVRQQQAMPPLPPAGRLPMYPPPGGPRGPGGAAAPGGMPGPGGFVGQPAVPEPNAASFSARPPAGVPTGQPSPEQMRNGWSGPEQPGSGQPGAARSESGRPGEAQAGPSGGERGPSPREWPGQGLAGPVPPPAPA